MKQDSGMAPGWSVLVAVVTEAPLSKMGKNIVAVIFTGG